MKGKVYNSEIICDAIEKAIHEMDEKRKEPEADSLVLYSKVIGKIEAICENARAQLVTNKKEKQ